MSTGTNEISKLLALIGSNQRFLVTSHARPDGDAVGSVLAFSMLLDQLGKDCTAVLADPVPFIYRGLPQVERIAHSVPSNERFDVAIVLECDGVSRTGFDTLNASAMVNLDHHESARPFATLNWIDTNACAVAEMVFAVIRAAEASVTSAMATCLYTAVLTDTGAFSYRGTTSRTFALAEQLVGFGADASEIARQVYFSNPVSKMRLLGRVLANLHCEGELSWAWVTQEDMRCAGAAEEDCEGAVNYLIGIDGIEAAVFLREMPGDSGRFRLSLRSKGKVDVAHVAELLGGGGHRNASGCTLDGPLQAAKDRILKDLKDVMAAHPAQLPHQLC